MRVTEKGQVTIPKPIRDRLGIGPGSDVEFVDKLDRVELVKREPPQDHEQFMRHFETHIEQMRGTIDSRGMDGKEFVEWLRGPRDDLDHD